MLTFVRGQIRLKDVEDTENPDRVRIREKVIEEEGERMKTAAGGKEGTEAVTERGGEGGPIRVLAPDLDRKRLEGAVTGICIAGEALRRGKKERREGGGTGLPAREKRRIVGIGSLTAQRGGEEMTAETGR